MSNVSLVVLLDMFDTSSLYDLLVGYLTIIVSVNMMVHTISKLTQFTTPLDHANFSEHLSKLSNEI